VIFTDPRGYALAINKAWLWQWRGGQTTTEWLAPGMDERPSDWLWVWIAGVEKPHVLHRHNGGDELERALIQRHGSRDQVEAMLAAQMAVVHIATMAFARHLAGGECPLDTEGPERAFPKLARTFAAQVEALKRYRGKGERKAMGEGVELKAGGRGVVGTLPAADNSSKANGHSHERATHAPQPAMRSPNSERSTVPVPSDAERPLPHARRDVARSAERK
jgi:hypothetical protein